MEAWAADIGPRQRKELLSAIRELTREANTHDELSGVVGGKEHRTTFWVPIGGGNRPEVLALDEAIRERFGYQVNRKNLREVIAAYEAALPEARKSRPVQDTRRSQAEDTELQAKIAEREAGYQAKRDEQAELLAQVMAQAPPGAQALIVAQFNQDNSDVMTDYFSNQTQRSVAIGFRTGSREDFRQLRAAAARFPETAHMADQETYDAWRKAQMDDWQLERGFRSEGLERRDNYSMGKGNYLSDHGWDGAGTGWVVKSYAFPASWAHLTEVALPEPGAAAGQPYRMEPVPPGEPGDFGPGVTVSEGRGGSTEVRFTDKPSAEVRRGLKDHGFRWNGRDMYWYGRDAAYAASLLSSCCDECREEA